MDEETLSRPIGTLYRWDPDGSLHDVVDGLIVSNGLAWSADGATMFHSDSKGQVVWTYDYDADTGMPRNRRVLARPTEEIGRPDGAAVDVEGYYWSAGISAGVLNRWAPDGTLDRSIPLPVSNPTCPCFGGPDLRTIFVTSLRHDLPADVLAAKPASGGIVALRVDVPGVPVARYTG
jgi:sugar lactone lactonase YvrE